MPSSAFCPVASCNPNMVRSPSSVAGSIRSPISWIPGAHPQSGSSSLRSVHLQLPNQFPKACECLEKDKEVLFTFYDFPAQHWPHLRTTNPIESTFATIRLRTHRTKGSGSRIATLTMVFKLGHWRRLNGAELVAKVVTGVKLVDGEEQTKQAA
jgi:hypothetical protein